MLRVKHDKKRNKWVLFDFGYLAQFNDKETAYQAYHLEMEGEDWSHLKLKQGGNRIKPRPTVPEFTEEEKMVGWEILVNTVLAATERGLPIDALSSKSKEVAGYIRQSVRAS